MAAELLRLYELQVDSLTLLPSDGGRFEVKVNETLVFSKLQLGRFANPGEVEKRVGDFLKEGK